MSVVLVCINNFQDYILSNIDLLLRINVNSIFVITNRDFYNKFDKFNDKIKLVDIKELNINENIINKFKLDKTFRSGFWLFTSLRFIYIYELMKIYNLKNIFHIENDVLLYYDPVLLIDKLENYIYLPFDCYKRSIASIMYIPEQTLLKTAIDNWNYDKNDMENFYYIGKKTNVIRNFPIFNSKYCNTNEELFVSFNFSNLNYIFDAAAIGQYLGGVDSRNIKGNTIGFINETCVIKYNRYKFVWKNIDSINKPFIEINGELIPIFNLHIHSKNLDKFIS